MTPETKSTNFVERVRRKLQRVVRDTKRRRLASLVASTAPSPPVDQSLPFSVHMLLGSRELSMALCAAKSLNLAAERAMRWIFHDDGTLGYEGAEELTRAFPGSSVIWHGNTQRFAGFPTIRHWLGLSVLMTKLLDVPSCSVGSRFVLIDADVLFFKRPDALLESAHQATGPTLFNADIDTAYVFPPDTLEKACHVRPRERLNSGVVVANRDVVDPHQIEIWLKALPLDQPFILHRVEQTLYALFASADGRGVEHLPREYDVSFDKDVRRSVCKHYVGAIRHGFELEGLDYLLNELDFLNHWNQFARGK